MEYHLCLLEKIMDVYIVLIMFALHSMIMRCISKVDTFLQQGPFFYLSHRDKTRPVPITVWWITCLHFYASAFRCRRHYVFGLSVRQSGRPSVRSLKYPLLTCTWVRWSTRLTVTVLRHVRPSVRPSVCPSVRKGFRAFVGECMEGLAWNFTCWCILTIFRTD